MTIKFEFFNLYQDLSRKKKNQTHHTRQINPNVDDNNYEIHLR